MRYFAFACDYDSTLAHEGLVASTTAAALRRLAASGRKLILVTGRELDDLKRVFPEHEIFHRIVAENGALLYNPAKRQSKPLGDSPSEEFIRALRRARIEPLSIGASIIATTQPNGEAVLKVIHDLGLEMQVIYNRDAAMILPSGVNKATGLRAALPELALSPHNTVAVGDAENDHALLNVCEFRVAVANAIPTLKDRADFVTTEPDGKGVEQLIEMMLRDDLRNLPTREPRYPVLLGRSKDGQDVTIPSFGPNLVLGGPSGSSKSAVVMAIVERLLENRYQICLIDPEGDFDGIEQTVALGNPSRAPEPAEVSAALQNPKTSVTVNLLGLPVADRPLFLASLLPQIEELRARTGRPHWLIIDEAHHLLPSSRNSTMASIALDITNLLLTLDISSLSTAALASVNGIVAVGPTPGELVRNFAKAKALPPPPMMPLSSERGQVVLWLLDDNRGPVSVSVTPASGENR